MSDKTWHELTDREKRQQLVPAGHVQVWQHEAALEEKRYYRQLWLEEKAAREEVERERNLYRSIIEESGLTVNDFDPAELGGDWTAGGDEVRL